MKSLEERGKSMDVFARLLLLCFLGAIFLDACTWLYKCDPEFKGFKLIMLYLRMYGSLIGIIWILLEWLL